MIKEAKHTKSQFYSKIRLNIVVFICGAIVMIFELVGSRVLAPFSGTSIYVWTNLIGVIMASLAIGYWFGGKIADKNPTTEQLGAIIFFAALAMVITAFVKNDIQVLLNNISKSSFRISSFFTSVLLFSPVSVCLGMVLPYAVRLRLTKIDESGQTVGNLYAISTIGSILGTILAGYFLIPSISITNIIVLLAIILLSLAFFLFLGIFKKRKLELLFLLGLSIWLLISPSKKTIEIDTMYNSVSIYDATNDSSQIVRYMQLNNQINSAKYTNNFELVYDYLKFFYCAEFFNPNIKKTLMLGGAAFIFPMNFLEKYPKGTIDVVEIDGQLTEIAKKHFGLVENSRMNIIAEDARTFINTSNLKYDVIWGDAFNCQNSLPYQLTTVESVSKMNNLLNNNGVLVYNIISSIDANLSLFLKAELATFKQVFKQVYTFAVDNPNDLHKIQNIILVAYKSDQVPSFNKGDVKFEKYLSKKIDLNDDSNIILMDEFAPVEYLLLK